MKKLIFVFVLFACALGLHTTNSNAQALGFYIANNTGVTLNNIYVSPAESSNWGPDILPH